MGRTQKIWLALKIFAVIVAVYMGFTAYQLYQLFEQIDNTVPHGDQCLAELQGENYRCWDLFVPDDLGDEAVPLVIDLHGYFNSPKTQRGYSNFETLAAEEKFIVVWPYGIDYSWNGGGEPWPEKNKPAQVVGEGCCGPALFYSIDDVGFLVDMVKQLVQEQPIDEQRIYLSGFSTGCVMAQRLASEHSELFAGLACMAGTVMVDAASDYSPLSILEIRGSEDDTAPYETDYWLGAMDNFETWKLRNNCHGSTEIVWQEGNHRMIRTNDCTNGTLVAQLTIMGAGHLVYEDAGEIDITRIAWDFLVGETEVSKP